MGNFENVFKAEENTCTRKGVYYKEAGVILDDENQVCVLGKSGEVNEKKDGYISSKEELIKAVKGEGERLREEVLELIEVKLLRIVDGDTIEVLYRGRKEKIRMIGIDTPEKHKSKKSNRLVECFGVEASAHLGKLLAGKNIFLEPERTKGRLKLGEQFSRGKYWRILAYVWANGENINLKMIRDGYAYEYTYKGNEYKYQQIFKDAQKYARENDKGLWHPDSCNGEREMKKINSKIN
ncbi:MAG: thermonuclease family protein [Candidatus Gracilibacteria bacterium]|nr:thermonuclease family protein [Candidatus Gracilibacteria bacterium]